MPVRNNQKKKKERKLGPRDSSVDSMHFGYREIETDKSSKSYSWHIASSILYVFILAWSIIFVCSNILNMYTNILLVIRVMLCSYSTHVQLQLGEIK